MSTDPGSYSKEAFRLPDTASFDEADWIRGCQNGDFSGFDRLVLRYQTAVYAVCLRMLRDPHEAEDVAQEAFVRAYRAIGSFKGGSKFSTWMIAIAINLCRNRRRWWARRRRRIAGSLEDTLQTEEGSVGYEPQDTAPTPSQAAVSYETQAHILGMLQRLNESDRSIIVLRDLQGCSYDEIAQVLRVRIGTVKSRLNRARLQLRALLNGWLS